MTTPTREALIAARDDFASFDRFVSNPSNIYPFVENDLVREKNRKTIMALIEAALAEPQEAESIQRPGYGEIDYTNHHNALLCPYCNREGTLQPAPADPAAVQTVREKISVLHLQQHLENSIYEPATLEQQWHVDGWNKALEAAQDYLSRLFPEEKP